MGIEGLRIAIACEDQAHRALATFLADRVLLDEAGLRAADWVNGDSIDYYRFYCGLDEGSGHDEATAHRRFYSLSHARRDAEAFGDRVRIGNKPVKLRGSIDGKPLEPEAQFWRRVLVLFGALPRPPDVLIVVHDTDGDLNRLRGLEQALAVHEVFPVITATPHQDAEAWFLAGFVPQDKMERSRLEERKRELGFYPNEAAHRLTAHPNDSRKDAKRVLRILFFGENASKPPTLEELPEVCERALSDLALLEQRGVECRLVEFIRQLRHILVPLVLSGSPDRSEAGGG